MITWTPRTLPEAVRHLLRGGAREEFAGGCATGTIPSRPRLSRRRAVTDFESTCEVGHGNARSERTGKQIRKAALDDATPGAGGGDGGCAGGFAGVSASDSYVARDSVGDRAGVPHFFAGRRRLA